MPSLIQKFTNHIKIQINAQEEVPLGNLRGKGPLGLEKVNNPKEASTIFADAISKVVGIMTVVAAIWFIIQIIIAGYNFISGGGDSQKIQEAQKKIVNAVIGLAVVIFSIGFLSLIEYLLNIKLLDISNIINQLSP